MEAEAEEAVRLTPLPPTLFMVLDPSKFIAANLGDSILRAPSVGARVNYSLSEPAQVSFTARRVGKGRRWAAAA